MTDCGIVDIGAFWLTQRSLDWLYVSFCLTGASLVKLILVHSHVGHMKQAIAILTVLREGCEPDGGGYRPLHAHADIILHSRGYSGRLRFSGIRKQDDKLIPPEPRSNISLTDMLTDHLSNSHQNPVARQMPLLVINQLEVIHIHNNQ